MRKITTEFNMREAELDNKNEVLLVDDDEISLYLNQVVIGHMEVKYISGFLAVEHALEYLSLPQQIERNFLMLLDINMPVVDGWAMLEILKTHPLASSISVIMVSSSLDVNDIKRSSEYSMVIDYLVKPLNEQKLLSSQAKNPCLQKFLNSNG